MVRIKVVRGQEPGGLCRYLLSLEKRAPGHEQDDPILLSNMFSASADELAEELRFSADLNSRVQKTVCHYQISFPPKENPPLPTKQAIVADLLAARGHGDNCQFFALEHFDQVHKNEVHHLHVVASAVRLDGTWVNGDFEWVALRQVERDLEEAHGLRLCPPKPERERQNLTTGESRLKERTGATLPKEQLWDEIKLAAADRPTMPELVMRLKAVGVEVQFHDLDQKRKHKGLSFAINGSKFQGGKLGKSYSLGGLKQHRQVSYEPERDDDLLRQFNGLSAEECRSRLEAVQPQQAALEPPEVQIDQIALAQHLSALVREIWQGEKAGRPNLKASTFEAYSVQAEEEDQPQLFRQGELILEATENGYQGHGLTEADGEAVERHERLSNQRHHERELQQQAHERELTLHTTPAPSNPEAAIPQPECPTSAPATSSPVATDFNPHDAARSMLQHFRQHLKKIQKHKKITTPDGYCVTIDQSRSITITRQSSDGTQKVIAQDKKIPEGWKVAIAQVTSAEWQTFERYQAAREKQQAKQRKLGKSKDQGIGD